MFEKKNWIFTKFLIFLGDPNALPPMKDPMLVSPMKSQPPRIPGMDNTNHSTNDGMDIE